jgi:hypothetical protein
VLRVLHLKVCSSRKRRQGGLQAEEYTIFASQETSLTRDKDRLMALILLQKYLSGLHMGLQLILATLQ